MSCRDVACCVSANSAHAAAKILRPTRAQSTGDPQTCMRDNYRIVDSYVTVQ